VAKSFKNLWPQVVSFENLLLAARKAQKGKRFMENTARFNLNLEKELLCLQSELTNESYRPGRYREFTIYEPVRRMISAAPYRDRVVHHALCNVIEPLFEKGFIHDNYANRRDKGTHRAIDRFQGYMRNYRFVLKCDIRKYFPSIDHDILLDILRRKVADKDVMRLVETIVRSSNPQEAVLDYHPGDDLFTPYERHKGLPIGNLTSQFLANIYLNGFDHFIKDEMGCRAYLRYVDDFAVFGNKKDRLWEIKRLIDVYLEGLRLRLHEKKTRVFPVSSGCEFLGFHLYPNMRRVKRANVDMFRKRLSRMQRQYSDGAIALDTIKQSLNGWLGHVRYANSYKLRTKIFAEVSFCRGAG
jgi:retron-type reverse transcriptase